MSTKITVTGNLGKQPELRKTPSGKSVLDLSIAGTNRIKDKHTNQWSDDGEPVWVRATFWDWEAENLAGTLQKGDKVTVEGVFVVETYPVSDRGERGQQFLVRFPKFLGVIPRKVASTPQNGAQWGVVQANGSEGDPWATQPPVAPQTGAYATSEPPF